MGAQSIKIPVQLEIQQLQGSINYIKKALDKLDPGTNLYKSLEKGLNKVIHQMNALEVESKQSFGSVKDIENFEKNFNKVGTSVQELGNLLNKVSFSDLGKIFSKGDLQPIEDAKDEIKNLQQSISKIKTDKMFELTRGSKEFEESISSVGANTFEKAVKGIETQVGLLTKKINDAEASITGFKNTLEKEMDLSKDFNKVSSIDAIKNNFFTAFKNSKGEESHRFKAGGKNQLLALLRGMGLTESEIGDTTKLAYDNIDKFYDNISKKIEQKIKKQNDAVKKAQTTYDTALTQQDTRLQTRENYNSALAQLRGIEVDPTVLATIEQMNAAIEEQEQKIIELQKQLLIASGIQEAAAKATMESAEANEKQAKTSKEAANAAREQAKAQELLSDIKFAIKNWFGFNEVINLTKNAVRNMITQIRELDDVMTQIAIVTDMTQQELWDQMDTYSAMAQQYGASIKGVYEVSQLYYQQGLQTAEVMNLTEETLKMAKIANLDYAEATDYMTVALRGFKLEMSDAQQVTDVYSALAAATASDTEELAVAMSKTASSAEAVGSSFESTSAMIATMISITREAPENIGSALKSIISRYGEMTSDPMKLVDSEGEEMSLNKVDKALQSVGISLQNTQGQFRDFDDVILELSKSWDTIDTNTQRYIATIMAGNRQQSRFLALVGNYEEYAKALEVAENAEDAGTLQTLKTMDSISTKWEQLKVSLQEFYTSMGLEDVFKGVLDALTAFLTKANDIPKLFGKIPVSVIALASSLITSVKSVATSLTSSLTGPISEFNKKLDEIRQKGNIDTKIKTTEQTPTAKEQIDANKAYGAANPITQKIIIGSNTNTAIPSTNKISNRPGSGTDKYKQALEKANQIKNKTINTENEVSKTLEKTNNLYSKGQKFVSKYAGTISLLASTFSALALTIKDSSSSTIEWSKGLSGFANAAAGAVLGFFGQWQYAIPMLISGIPTLIDGLIYTTEEKLKNATAKATELSNEALQKKSDYKNLKNETKELENLTEARHDSAEAYQEWLDYNNQMASSYPELISYIDSEGNAIIDLAASYNSLEIARLAAAKAAKESIVADLDQAKIDKQNSDEKLSNFYKNIDISHESAFAQLSGFKIESNQASLESITEENAIFFLENYFNELGLVIDEETQRQINETGKFLSTSADFKDFLASPDDGVVSNSIFNTLVSDLELDGIINLADLQNYTRSFTEGITQPSENYSFLTDEVNEVISIYEEIKAGTKSIEDLIPFISNADKMKELSKVIIQARKNSTEEGDAYDQAADALEELVTLHGSYQALIAEQALKDKQLAATNEKAISTYAYYDNEASEREVGEELNNFNKIVTDYLVRKWKQSGKEILDYLGTDESQDYEEFENAFQEIWKNLSSSQQVALNELLASSEDYDFGDYKEALADFGITQGVIYDELTTQWYEEYGQAYFNFINAISSRQEKDSSYLSKGISQLQNIAPKYYDEILDFYDKVNLQISDGLISQIQGSDILDAYSSLWQQSKGLENEAEIQKILAEGDFTSLDGIYSLKESLKKAGFDANTILENLANSINVNVLTEWETFGQKVKTGLKSFTEALTNATEGMDYEDAINMASKLEMSLSDFRFEDGKYFLDDIEAIQKVYGNFGEELKNKLIEQTNKELNTLLMQRESAYKMGDYKTAADLSSQMAEIQTAQANVESSVDEYIAYHTNLAYLTAGLYDGFIQQIGGNGSVAEMLAAGRESDTKLREYLLALGSENITEETVDGYVAAITDRISSVNDSILSLILDKNVGKGGSADISHLVEKTDLEEFTKITAEKIPELFAKMFGENYEAYNDAMLQYMEDSSADISGMIADLAGDIEHIDYSSVFEIANALGKNVNEIIGLFTDNLDGTFSTSLNNIQTLAQIAGTGITSEIQNAIREYLDNILGIVSNGISGSMTNVEFETLSNFMGLDLDFTETAEGLKLTKASAIEVYTELKRIDSIQAQITFFDLAESLEEAGSGYEDVASTMQTIAELNRELADVPVSSERRTELERELAVAEEILRVRSQDPDSFNFMDKDLPTGMQGPENYWNSVGEAYKVMNESAKSGYMEIQDYVNIINHMSQMVEAAGGEFQIANMNAAQLIEAGMSSLTNIDGEGVKVNLENLGIDILGGTEGMSANFDSAIKEMARGQIEMLDAAIQMLETIVAMEEIGNIDTEGDGIDLGDILKFNLDGTIEYEENYETVRKNILTAAESNTELKAALESFFIDGKSMFEWLNLNAEEFNKMSAEAKENYIKSLEAISQLAESDDYDLDNLLTSINQLVENSGLAATINYTNENGTQIIVRPGEPSVAIEWESDKVKKLLQGKSEEEVAQIKQTVNDWANGKSLTPIELATVYQLLEKVTLSEDGNYIFQGKEYKTPGQLAYAINEYEAKTKEETPETPTKTEKELVTETSITEKQNISIDGREVTLEKNSEGKETYTFNGKEYSSYGEALNAVKSFNKMTQKADQEELERSEGMGITVKETETVSAGATLEISAVTETKLAAGVQPEAGFKLTEPVKVTATANSLEITSITNPTLANATENSEATPIDIGNIGVVSGTASELKITSIPSEGTYSPEGEDSTGKITITGGIPNAEGEVATITLTPIAGATSSVSGDIPAADVTTVTINGKTYTVDVSQGTQTNTTMELTGVKAGSAAVEATKYTVTFTNANGTTQTVVVQGEAQLAAVLTNATNIGGTWQLNNITAQADVSISETSKTSLTTFFDELIEKLKNIEVSITPADSPTPANGQTSGTYNASITNTTTGTPQNYSNIDMSGLIATIQSQIANGFANAGQYTIEKIAADGSVIESTELTIDSTTATITGQEIKSSSSDSSSGKDSSSSSSSSNKSSGQGSPTLDLTVIKDALTGLTLPIANAATLIKNLSSYIELIPDNSLSVTNLSSAISSLTDKSQAVQNTADAINKLQSKNISASVSVSVKVSKPSEATGNISISNGSGRGFTTGSSLSMRTNLSKAKGGVALAAGKTLMGELGPELVVSNGRYFIVGQNGAEFVNLAEDAIVFNHLQTQRLLKNGHAGIGRPVTNETKATSLATGNVSGPAMASAADALAQLRQIRAMWQSMLDATAKDLGSKAGGGSGGGGGGGGGGGDKEDLAAYIHDLERWYNLLRQIEKWEQKITFEQARRQNLQSGYDYSKSLQNELRMLKKQQAAYQELADLQRSYYDKRRQDLLSTDYSKIFTYDEDGLMQYVDGHNRGLDILAKLNETNANGKAKMNSQQQIAYLKSLGFDINQFRIKGDGTTLEAKDYGGMMEIFWEGIDTWMEELDGLYDSVNEHLTNVEENQAAQLEIWGEYTENQLSLEERLLTAMTDARQAEIDKLQDNLDALEDASASYIQGLNDALKKEQEMYNQNNEDAETAKLQKQLAILQRSGGSASEIKSLQEQLDARLQESYFNQQQEQIDSIQEAADKQAEKLQQQIDIATESLEYQKENGLFWDEILTMMNNWSVEEIMNYLATFGADLQPISPEDFKQQMAEIKKSIEMYKDFINNVQIDETELEKEAEEIWKNEMTGYSGEYKDYFINAYKNATGTSKERSEAAKAITQKEIDRVNFEAKKEEAYTDNLEYYNTGYIAELTNSFSEQIAQWAKVEEIWSKLDQNKRLNAQMDKLTEDETQFLISMGFSSGHGGYTGKQLVSVAQAQQAAIFNQMATNASKLTAYGSASQNYQNALDAEEIAPALYEQINADYGATSEESLLLAKAFDARAKFSDAERTKLVELLNSLKTNTNYENFDLENFASVIDSIANNSNFHKYKTTATTAFNNAYKNLAALALNSENAAKYLYSSSEAGQQSYNSLYRLDEKFWETEEGKILKENLDKNNNGLEPDELAQISPITVTRESKEEGEKRLYYTNSNLSGRGYQIGSGLPFQITGFLGKNQSYTGDVIRFIYGGATLYAKASSLLTEEDWKLMRAQLTALNGGIFPKFAKGGLVDFTGPAWVDGTKTKPEAFLSAEDTALLKDKIFSNSNYSLKATVDTIRELVNSFGTITNSSISEGGIVFENVTVEIQPGVISSDYDARRAGEMALEEMVKIARRSTNLNAIRR